MKGMEASVTVVQKNWESDGKDKVLDCGVFEIDSVDASGPPAKVTLTTEERICAGTESK